MRKAALPLDALPLGLQISTMQGLHLHRPAARLHTNSTSYESLRPPLRATSQPTGPSKAEVTTRSHEPQRSRVLARSGVAEGADTAASTSGITAAHDLALDNGASSNGTALGHAAAEDESPSTSGSSGYDGIMMQPQKRALGLSVRVRNMVKHFKTAKGVFKAVDGVDVTIEPSSITALLGPSGSGKTTLLRLIAGLEAPTDGRIFFDDLDATDLSVQERQIGFVFQSYALFNHMNVAENIKFGLQVRQLQVDHDKRVADLLELVQLQGLGDRYPRQLSGGQRQRVALARALASNPRLLLLDEPFGALDAVVRKQLRAGLKEIVRSVGVTTIIVTHDQEEAFDLADQVVVFNRGLIEQQGSPASIISAPRTPFIMKFVGDTNVVPAGCLLVKRARFATDKAYVMFRPTDIEVLKEFSAERLLTPATITDKFNLGWVVKYVVRFDDDVEIEFAVSRDQDLARYSLEPGQRVYLHVPPSAMMAFEEDEVESTPLL